MINSLQRTQSTQIKPGFTTKKLNKNITIRFDLPLPLDKTEAYKTKNDSFLETKKQKLR